MLISSNTARMPRATSVQRLASDEYGQDALNHLLAQIRVPLFDGQPCPLRRLAKPDWSHFHRRRVIASYRSTPSDGNSRVTEAGRVVGDHRTSLHPASETFTGGCPLGGGW